VLLIVSGSEAGGKLKLTNFRGCRIMILSFVNPHAFWQNRTKETEQQTMSKKSVKSVTENSTQKVEKAVQAYHTDVFVGRQGNCGCTPLARRRENCWCTRKMAFTRKSHSGNWIDHEALPFPGFLSAPSYKGKSRTSMHFPLRISRMNTAMSLSGWTKVHTLLFSFSA